MMRRIGTFTLAAALLLTACDGGSTDPDDDVVVPEDRLTFIRFAEGVTLPVRDTSFVVTAGTDFRLELFTEDSVRFLRFELDDETLLRRPNGTAFQAGDTVTIHLTIPGDAFVFHFEPSGLVFHPDAPAELEIEYDVADDDYDDDGDIDGDDDAYESELYIWRQEAPGLPWMRMGKVHVEDLNEIEAELGGFTGFALAGN